MSTTVAFSPSATASPPFQATVTLDGTQYALSAFWNVYRGDWYYSIADQSGNVLVTAALVGSPPGAPIYLAPGIFSASTIYYQPSSGNFVITP